MPSEPTPVLLIDDDPETSVLTRRLLALREDPRFTLDRADPYGAAVEAVGKREHAAYLLVDRPGDRDRVELLRELVALACGRPVLLLTEQGNPRVEEAAMRAGAADCLVADEITAASLERAIRHAIARKRAAEET